MATQKKVKTSPAEISDRLQEKAKMMDLTAQQKDQVAQKMERETTFLKAEGVKEAKATRKEEDKIGIINPRALVEAVLGQEVDWKQADSNRLIEEVLERDYQDLITNKDSILFAGRDEKVTVRKEPDLEDLQATVNLNDLNSKVGAGLKVANLEKRGNRISLDLVIPEMRDKVLSRNHLTPKLKELLIPNAAPTRNSGNNEFCENGLFVNYSPNRYDSIMQGAVGNCYFLAALSSIAWVHPGILNRIDIDQSGSDDPLRYYHYFAGGGHKDSDGWGGTNSKYYTEGYQALPVYGRSRDWKNGDNWVSYWEQMYASYRFGGSDIRAAILSTNGGWPDYALREISGSRWWAMSTFHLKSNSESALRSLMFDKTDSSWKTNVPMTAWTYSTNLSNLPIGHAYSVLGVIYLSGDYYVIIRNPWGHTEPSGGGMLSGEYLKNHFGKNEKWRFSDWDGIFAMRTDVMKANFDYIGYIY